MIFAVSDAVVELFCMKCSISLLLVAWSPSFPDQAFYITFSALRLSAKFFLLAVSFFQSTERLGKKAHRSHFFIFDV